MINKDEKMLLLRACTIEDQQAVVVPEERTVQFEISGREPAAQDSSPGRLGRRPPEALLWMNTCLRIRQFALAWLTLNPSI